VRAGAAEGAGKGDDALAMRTGRSPFELVLCGLFGAAALVLPMIFHAVGLGKVFMPMFLPLLVLSFLVSAPLAAVTAVAVPVVSFLLTGMPPAYPPALPKMCVELAVMATVASLAYRRARWGLFPSLVLAIVTERVVYVVLTIVIVGLFHLPGREITLGLLLVSWPGVLLQLTVAPAVVRLVEPRVRRMLEVA